MEATRSSDLKQFFSVLFVDEHGPHGSTHSLFIVNWSRVPPFSIGIVGSNDVLTGVVNLDSPGFCLLYSLTNADDTTGYHRFFNYRLNYPFLVRHANYTQVLGKHHETLGCISNFSFLKLRKKSLPKQLV